MFNAYLRLTEIYQDLILTRTNKKRHYFEISFIATPLIFLHRTAISFSLPQFLFGAV